MPGQSIAISESVNIKNKRLKKMSAINWNEVEVAIDQLKPFESNPRHITPKQYERLVASLRENGYHQRILATEDYRIIGGHQRIKALRELGFAVVRVLVPDSVITDAQFRRLLIQDNIPFGEFDKAMLIAEFPKAELVAWGMPAEWCQFGKTNKGTRDEDDAPALPTTPVTQIGDTWLLGEHRLHCGDATIPGHVEKMTGGGKVDCILTDPPYCSGGFQEAGKSAGSIGSLQIHKGGRFEGGIANDKLSTRGYMALMKSVIGLIPAGVIYAFTDWRMWINLFDVAESSGFNVRNMVVWDKETPGMGMGWRMQHELILFGVRGTVKFDNHKAVGNVLKAKRTGNLLHPTQKPVEILESIINLTDMAETFADPFAGSGSVLLAAEKCGRKCYSMELSPQFCDVIVTRWQEFTGKQATHAVTGAPFKREAEAA